MTDKKYSFYIPDDSNNAPLVNFKTLLLMKYRKDLFYDDFRIKSVFGNPPSCKWAGGRIIGQIVPLKDKYYITIPKLYRMFGVGYSLTFSNLLVNEKYLGDKYCNYILSKYNYKGNSVIVSTDCLKEYISKKYKNLSIINSITRCEETIEEVNALSEHYLTCPPIKWNNDFESLKKFKYPSNLEILCTESCVENCPNIKNHYMSFSEYNLLGSTEKNKKCIFPKEKTDVPLFQRKHAVPRELFEKYYALGIHNFKISGRQTSEHHFTWLYSLYFVKEDCREEYSKLMKSSLEDLMNQFHYPFLKRKRILKYMGILDEYNKEGFVRINKG